VSLLLHAVNLWDVDHGPPPAPVTSTDQRIAVLVPTYNEGREVLLPTIAAAVAMRLPHETWVLDDGRRPWVAKLAEHLGARYTSREDNAHAKAGNLNALLPLLDVDLVAVLDADHVARVDFLERTLGYFADPRVALVQTPQDFYNTDGFEHIDRPGGRRFSEQELFYRALAAGKNRWNAGFWCGTNAVLRLAALRDVGGVAVGTVTEDIHTTIRLHRRGWRTVYYNEVLARGLSAANAVQYLGQRLRWGTGAMQVLRHENPAFVSGLRPMQRIAYLGTLLGWFDSWRTLGYVLLPAATLLTGGVPIGAPATTFLVWFAAVFLSQRLALRVLARGRAPLLHAALFDFVRLPACLRATLTLFSGRPRRFTVTAKGREAGDTRERIGVPPLLSVLLVLSAAVTAWYVATLAGLTPVAYPVPWIAHGAMTWLAVNATLLALAAHRIRRRRFGAERRAAVRFDRSGRAGVDSVLCRLDDVSLTGASVTAPAGLLRPGRRVHLRFGLRSATFALDAVVRTVTGIPARGTREQAGLEFRWMSPTTQADLALALFATGVAPVPVDPGTTREGTPPGPAVA
jgi:cellulose synthase (UDP-forming)